MPRQRYTGTLAAYIEERSMPEPNSGCWLWLLGTGSHGYGQTKLRGKWLLAHRLAWEAKNGPIKRGLNICHKCDNRLCVNADHMFLGTLSDNNADMVSKGRHCIGERNARAKITDEIAVAIYIADGTHHAIAHHFAVSRTTVTHIKNGNAWSHATGALQ